LEAKAKDFKHIQNGDCKAKPAVAAISRKAESNSEVIP
jgi:hypothetical protein